MAVTPLVLEFVCIFVVTAYFIYRYGNVKRQHSLVTLAAFVAWYFSFLIVFILPLDITSTIYRQCLYNAKSSDTSNTTGSTNVTPTGSSRVSSDPELWLDKEKRCIKPNSYVHSTVLTTLWRIIYWTSQVLTWLILPIMQSYSSAGNFTVAGKIKSAVIENLIFYGTYALIFLVCLIYVAANYDLDGDKMKVIGITASNTWGLFLLVLLLGYGLIDVPRRVWNSSKQGHLLHRTQFKVAKISTEKTEAEENLEDIFDETRTTAERIPHTHPLRKHMDIILEKLRDELGRNEKSCPESFRTSLLSHTDFREYSADSQLLTEATLIQLHKKVIKYMRANHRTQVQWNMLMDKAFELQRVATNENRSERTFIREASEVKRSTVYTYCSALYTPTIEWWVVCRVKPYARKTLAIVLMLMTLMVVWSECLFFISSPVLTFFALFVNASTTASAYWLIEFGCIVSISFVCWCAYHSVFQIKILNFYYIAPHHQTDERSLLFVGMMLCRLTPPLCLNFLGLLHMDSHIVNQVGVVETSYTHIMGHMDVIAIISSGFNIYFPMLILLLCVFTYFNLGSRLLHFVGIQQFIGDDDDVTQDLVDEGRELIRQELRRKERLDQGDVRRREWSDKFGDQSASYTSIQTRRERSKVASRATNDDKMNLLADSEPVDYTEDTYCSDSPDASLLTSDYQTQSSRAAQPARGIFDDV